MSNNIVFDLTYTPLVADFGGPAFNCKGGRLVLGGFGTFGAGTLKLQFTTDADTTWVDLDPQTGGATSLTAAGSAVAYVPIGRYRVALVGSSTPSLTYFVGEANVT